MTLISRMLLAVALLMPAGQMSVAVAAAPATATVTLKATFTTPPCSITFPETVRLGTISPGERNYPPFSINISCEAGSTPTTALFAEIVRGNLTSGRTDRIDMTGPEGSNGTPAQLWLMSPDGTAVVMDGSGSTNLDSQFCTGTTDRQCMLTPYTQVASDTPRGETSAVVRFSVAYP